MTKFQKWKDDLCVGDAVTIFYFAHDTCKVCPAKNDCKDESSCAITLREWFISANEEEVDDD